MTPKRSFVLGRLVRSLLCAFVCITLLSGCMALVERQIIIGVFNPHPDDYTLKADDKGMDYAGGLKLKVRF